MKFVVTLVAFFASLAFTEAEHIPIFVQSFQHLYRGPPDSIVNTQNKSSAGDVRTKWITEKLDHFDQYNNKTWKMRYMENDKYLEHNGAMFIYLGGEWATKSVSISKGLLTDLAHEHQGILFYVEHRYYGESRPTSDLSVENLKYLHVKQALADVAHFIRYQRETNPRLTNSKVIIAGCSYSASMVVWFSKLYPELVNGGWASSAPILAKVDFEEYYEVTGTAILELGSQDCYNRIKNGIAKLEAMFENNRSAEAKAMLKLCNNFDHNNDLDLWSLFSAISNSIADAVQYQKNKDVPKLCEYLLSFEDDAVALASYFLREHSNKTDCIDVKYEKYLEHVRRTTFTAHRAWIYQTCSEFGWYPTSTSKNQPFGTKIPLALHTSLCYDTFGPKYTKEAIYNHVAETNKDFGGMDPQVKNIFMTQGALDPWSALGFNKTQGAYVIPRASHCADLGSISNKDSVEMRSAKERLIELVREWLA